MTVARRPPLLSWFFVVGYVCAFVYHQPLLPRSSRSMQSTTTKEDAESKSYATNLSLSQKRQLLLDKYAEILYFTKIMGSSSYATATWSNRLGSVLTPASIPGVYTADRPFYWNAIDVGGRMTVIQLPLSSSTENELVIHSPVHLDKALFEVLAHLGQVTHIISPNYEHVKYAKQWAEHYPTAKVWGCPGLSRRVLDVQWTGELPFGVRPPGFYNKGTDQTALLDESRMVEQGSNDSSDSGSDVVTGMWDWDVLQPMHVDTEINPFTRQSFFNEVIFYHKPSKTLLTTDIYWNYPQNDGVTNGQLSRSIMEEENNNNNNNNGDEDFGVWELAPNIVNDAIPTGSRLWGKVGMDRLFQPFYNNFMIRQDKRRKFNDIVKFMTSCGDGGGWDIETIIPCHGDIIRGRSLCRKVLRRHFSMK